MYKQIINQLTTKYKKTGKIGFIMPESKEQADKIIKALAEAYIQELQESKIKGE